MTSDEHAEIEGRWDYSSLPANVVVGRDCWLERKASFASFRSEQMPGVVIGDRVKVYTWASFNVEAGGRIDVGDDSILVGAIFMCAKQISIGKRVIVSYNVTIADSDFHPINPELRKRDAIALAPFGDQRLRPDFVSRPVFIEDDVSIGIGAIILKGVRVGRGARVAAGAVVTSSVPPGCEVAGNPARPRDAAGK